MNIRILFFLIFNILGMVAIARNRIIVTDSISGEPLYSASIFDRNGNIIGITQKNGQLPYVSPGDLPITIRFLGYNEKIIFEFRSDTILMSETFTALPEVLVESKQHKVLHTLAYVREYSTLSTYTDTIFLFREKMVDFMQKTMKSIRFKDWSSPRVISSRSYYRFTNNNGLDSVSNICTHHFSWSDWIGLVTPPVIPKSLKRVKIGSDTIKGNYSPAEIWTRHDDIISIDVDVLANTNSRKWVTNLSPFFKNHINFENFKIRFKFSNVLGDSIYLTDIESYSFVIESRGRGHDMFRFNNINQPFFVSTYAEVYIIDKEYITLKEAKRWEKRKFNEEDIEIIEAADAPKIQAFINDLIYRVNAVNNDQVRQTLKPDKRLAGRRIRKQNFGERGLALLKQLSGITYYKSHKNANKQWDTFNKEQIQNNITNRGDP